MLDLILLNTNNIISFGIIFSLFLMIFFLICSALISGAETSLFSINSHQINILKSEKSKNSKQIIKLLENPKLLLATVLISNNFVNIAVVIISTYLSSELFYIVEYPILSFIIQIVIVTFLILLVGEIVPKVYATKYNLKFASFISFPMIIMIKLFYPISILLVKSTSIIDKHISKKSHNISIDELSHALDITSNDNRPEQEKKILRGIVKFGNIDVKEIMRYRIDVVAVDYNTNFDKLIQIILDSGYSRMPVYHESFDKIEGILYIKDLLPHLEEKPNYKWQTLIRAPFFIPESKKINDLLREFQEKKIHMAVVVDEYGGTSGIITLEDVVEEIVGEINDEFDNEEVFYSKIDDENYIFEAKTQLNDFAKVLGIDSSIFNIAKGESDTLAGLILEIVGKIPEKNDSISFENFEFKIDSADKRRIKKIKVTIKK